MQSLPVRARSVAAALALLVASGCGPQAGTTPAARSDEKPLVIRSFTETRGVTSLAANATTLWVGTTRGLVTWDLASHAWRAVTQEEGLPGDRVLAVAEDGSRGVWVLTAAGVAHESKGAWRNQPAAPVGEFITAAVVAGDGALWAGGPEGLARLGHDGKWTKLLGATAVTALAPSGKEMWVGTGGRGVVRVVGGEAQLFGADQGCEIEVVRGLAPTPAGLIAIGDAPGGPRVALWDGKRFWSYRAELAAGASLEWVRRIGGETLVASGRQVVVVVPAETTSTPSGPVKLALVPRTQPRKAPVVVPASGELPLPGAAGSEQKTSQQVPKEEKQNKASKVLFGAKTSGDGEPASELAPRLDTAAWAGKLPDGVTAVGADGPALWIGTRFLGASRITAEGATHFRTAELAQGATRVSVACEGQSDCYVATGAPRAWHFDGKTFEPTIVDPEPGSRVLMMLNLPSGGVLAIHRGQNDPALRMSSVGNGVWSPIGVSELQVPEGIPELSFATFAPNRRLWLGLYWVDKDNDRRGYGAVEVSPDDAKVVYHRQAARGERVASHGVPLPIDVEAACFDGDVGWFATDSGVVRLEGGKTRMYTENDGLESEIIRDIHVGPDHQIWVATSKGVGIFDGTRWRFPQVGDPLRVNATSIADDGRGSYFVGSDVGVLVRSPSGLEKIDATRGLLGDAILNVAVDKSGRVWALSEKGLSMIAR